MQVNRSDWLTAATYLAAGFAVPDVAAFMGCPQQDIEDLLRLADFQAVLADRRAAVSPASDEQLRKLVRRAAAAVAGPRNGSSADSIRTAGAEAPASARISLLDDALSYLQEAVPGASVRMVHSALASASRFDPGHEEPRVIDLRAALDWLGSRTREQ
jgi:hypothetical protein